MTITDTRVIQIKLQQRKKIYVHNIINNNKVVG